MIVHGLKSCDTTRAAMKALAAAGKSPQLRDLRAEPPSRGEIAQWLAALGPGALNRNSTTWRGLSEAEKALPAEELLAAHPTLIKRPVIEAEGQLTLGWGKSAQVKWL